MFGNHRTDVKSVDAESLAGLGLDGQFAVADTHTKDFVRLPRGSIVLQAGEAAKSWENLRDILEKMLEIDLTRGSWLSGIGGGVVCDISAAAASLYMRGLNLRLVPSSLVAMVDAALGGKTGVNFGGYKNIVGTFYPAHELLICSSLLTSLPEREYMSGLAEAIKTALLGDPELLTTMEDRSQDVASRDPELLEDIVWRCLEVKGGIVERDLTETGERAYLNLGHTFGHALEAVAGLGRWSHGEAVAWGLARAMELGVSLKITDPAYASRVIALLEQYRYDTERQPELTSRILAAMKKDKKRRGSGVRFVLQETLGSTQVVEVDDDQVIQVLGG